MEVFWVEGFSYMEMIDVIGVLNGLIYCLIFFGIWVGR